MSTLTITFTDEQATRYGLAADLITLDQLVDKIKADIAQEALDKCHAIGEETGLSQLTLDDINAEIQSVRNAQARH